MRNAAFASPRRRRTILVCPGEQHTTAPPIPTSPPTSARNSSRSISIPTSRPPRSRKPSASRSANSSPAQRARHHPHHRRPARLRPNPSRRHRQTRPPRRHPVPPRPRQKRKRPPRNPAKSRRPPHPNLPTRATAWRPRQAVLSLPCHGFDPSSGHSRVPVSLPFHDFDPSSGHRCLPLDASMPRCLDASPPPQTPPHESGKNHTDRTPRLPPTGHSTSASSRNQPPTPAPSG